MAFSTYIVLDGYRYKTLAKQWRPATTRPATPRLTLQGMMESTFGVGKIMRWQGVIVAPHSDEAPVGEDGNIVSLRASLLKTEQISFIDHNGGSYWVTATGPFEENALINVWNAPSNKYYVTATLTAQG